MANMLRSYIVKPPRVGMGAVSALGDTLDVGREDLAGVLRRGILLLRSNILLRTVDFKGGLDAFLMGTKNHKLTDKAKKIKKALIKKAAEAEAAA